MQRDRIALRDYVRARWWHRCLPRYPGAGFTVNAGIAINDGYCCNAGITCIAGVAGVAGVTSVAGIADVTCNAVIASITGIPGVSPLPVMLGILLCRSERICWHCFHYLHRSLMHAKSNTCFACNAGASCATSEASASEVFRLLHRQALTALTAKLGIRLLQGTLAQRPAVALPRCSNRHPVAQRPDVALPAVIAPESA
ncbi:hypothetical protein [Rhodococcus koreensis]|uniref:hypothetical protein n=1 Tax=Rhodococcus koreensis TaxID=99653 RepID=UPI0019813E45|nr:hypothetical protein [Rhodococcus koreensis]QSE87094.1 hypothetical protein JWS14_49350 [Rhodococcus koreensis]